MSTTTSTLNELIETLKDGQQGFSTAAQDIKSADLKAVLSGYATQRDQFATELQVLAKDFGDENPTKQGSVAGAIHRGWINLKAAIASRDEHAILSECERGEDSAVANYKKALESTELPPQVANALRHQFAEIKSAHDRVKYLRDSLAAAH